MSDEIDTSNEFMVGVNGGGIVVMRPFQRMTKDQALRLAAWIVALADDQAGEEGKKFAKLLTEVINT